MATILELLGLLLLLIVIGIGIILAVTWPIILIVWLIVRKKKED